MFQLYQQEIQKEFDFQKLYLKNITSLIKQNSFLEKGYIILKPKTEPRSGWEKAFKKMHENGDDTLLINDAFDDETLEEWS